MRKFQIPKKEKVSYIPLLQILIEKEFEEELIKAVLPYKEKPLSQQREGRLFREALQKHIWDPSFPDILASPKFRLLPAIQEQWLTAKEFYLVIFWLWKHANGDLFEQASDWLEKNQPEAGKIYADNFEQVESMEEQLSKWAEMFTKPPEKPDKAKLTMAVILYSAAHPDVFIKFTSEEKPVPSKKSKNEVGNMAHQKDNLWKSILDRLNKESIDKFQMTEFEQFVEQARVIVLQKIDEQQQEQRLSAISAEVQSTLDTLAPWESYFKFEEHRNWSVQALSPVTWNVVSEKKASLKDRLDRLDALLKSQPSSRDERRVRDQEVSKTEDEILAIYHELNTLFGISDPIDVTEQITEDAKPADEMPKQVETQIQAEMPEKLPQRNLEASTSDLISADRIDNEIPEAIIENTQDDENEPVAEANEVEEESLDESAYPLFEESEELQKEDEAEIKVEPQPAMQDYGIVNTDDVNHSLMSSVVEGNLSHAYWVALAHEQQNHEPVIPSWLLAGIQGTHWLISHWPDMPQSLLNDIHEAADPKNKKINSDQSILALSLALGLGLHESGAGWEEWLSVDIPATAIEINNLLIEVDTFTQGGNKLEPAIVQNILGKEQVEARIQKLAKNAATWLEQAPQRGNRFPGADDVWKRIVGSRGTLHSWLDMVAQDNRKSADKVREELETWSDLPWLNDHIQKLNREIRGGAKPIDGEARKQLTSRVLNAVEIARQWCDLILETNIDMGKKRWVWEQTTHFCDFLKRNLPKSIVEARELQSQFTKPMERIGYTVLEVTLRLLARNMGVEDGKSTMASNPFLDAHTLQENLARVLIYYPELSLNENGCPEKVFDEKEMAALVKAKHSEREAFDLWLGGKNYCFLNTLIDHMPQSQQDDTRRVMDNHLVDDIQRVEYEVDKTIVSIEQAVVDDLISEQDYVEAKSRVESIRKQLKHISSGGSNAGAFNFQIFLTDLFKIQEKFETSHNARLNNFEKHWGKLLSLLPNPKFISSDDDRAKVIELVEQSFKQKDLRAVAEAIAHLDDVVTGNEKFTLDLFSGKNVRYKVKEFNQEIIPMFRALDADPAMQKEGEKFSNNLPSERRYEVRDALNAWHKLKREGKNLREQSFPHVVTVMQYLGWDIGSGSPVSLAPQAPTGFQHWRVMANPRVPAPVPQFGSDRAKETSGRIGVYDVLGAWGRPGFDAIEALINHVGKKPFIMLYFGRMVPAQRAELLKLARRKQHPLVVVDELLMLFLAKEYDVRLSAMFECALPYSSANPYVPFATGSVPPEMYFGREDKIADLENPYGPSIVYGGRQLGKSALLRQVQRKFHNPERGQFAIYEDIRLIGDPMSEKDYRIEVAERLVNALRLGGVLEQSKQTIDIVRLSDLLINQIKSKGWRVILLIDEADMFLEADAGRKFTVVTTLKRVTDQTDRMFKVVFAGLHHVQQFTKTSNQPLAHLGDSGAIKIGPLEPISAIELIEKPLRSLGYIFGKPGQEDTSLIAHILSYTNYHPGLLQLFGQSLVDHLNQKSYGNLQPPYSITRSDIEAVYRTSKVREIIRDRFNITLALDERYEAITLSLILEQWDEKNGFDRLFSPEELLNISREHWAAGFGEDITIFKGFLDEMCGLGVLSSVSLEIGNDKYRLRSPNLVSLMGTESQIINRLDVISKSQPISQQRKLESYHAPVDPYYSPLTYAQERIIVGSSSGVCMIFGTQATHINNLSETLKKTAKTIGDWAEIKVSAKTEATLREQLKGLIKRSEKPIIAYRELDGTPEEMAEQVIAATHFCSQTRDKKLRVIFSLDASTAWKWFQIPSPRRVEIEQDYIDVLVTLDRWDKLGIRQLLEQHEPEIPAGDVNIKKIHEITGGWPNLMDKFIDLCRWTTEPLPVLDELKKRLTTEPERSHFITDLGLHDNAQIKDFLESVLKEDLKSLTAEDGLNYLFGEEQWEQAQIIMEYLRRLSVIQTTPYLHVEPVVAKLWHESKY